MRGGRKYLPFLHHEKRSHKRSDVLHLRWQYILLGPPVCFKHPIIVPGCRRVEKKKWKRTHFCEDRDRSKGISKVYSYDCLRGWYFYRSLRATIRDLSIERHSQVLSRAGYAGVGSGCQRRMPSFTLPQNQDYLILSNLQHGDA